MCFNNSRGGGGGLSVGFVIGMLSTARWLKLLQRAKNGVETILDLKKGGQNGRAYVVTFIDWIPSPGTGRLFDSKSLSKTIPHDPRKATKLTIVTALQFGMRLSSSAADSPATFERERMCYLSTWLCIDDKIIMYTWLDNYVYLIMYTCKIIMYTFI